MLLEINKIIDNKDKRDYDKAGKAAKKNKKTNAAKKAPPPPTTTTTTTPALRNQLQKRNVLENILVDKLLKDLFADEGGGVMTKERTYNKIEVKCMIRKVLAIKLVLPSVVDAGGNNMTQENVGGSVLNYQPTTGDDTLEMPEETEEQGQYYSNRSVTVPVENGETMSIDSLPKARVVMSALAKGRLEKQADVSAKLRKTILLSRQKDGTQNKPKGYHSSKLGRTYYASALYQAPYLSLYYAEQIFPLVIASFLADVGIVFDSAALATACPKRDSLKSDFVNNAVDSTIYLRTQFHAAVAVFIL